MTQFPSYSLSLADETHLTLTSADEQTATLLALFSAAAQLKPGNGLGHRLIMSMEGKCLLVETSEGAVFRFDPLPTQLADSLFLFGLSHVITVLTRSGILLHGALAECKNRGVVLIARGGTGKTTASKRLPPPWRSLSDDLTLVVHDVHGKYWAHPWPTWSHFYNHGKGGNWDVQSAIPLRAIFHLSQAKKDRAEQLGAGESVILLMQSYEQAFMPAKQSFDVEFVRKMRLRKLDHLSSLTRNIPVTRLHISLTGTFWNVMEEMLE